MENVLVLSQICFFNMEKNNNAAHKQLFVDDDGDDVEAS